MVLDSRFYCRLFHEPDPDRDVITTGFPACKITLELQGRSCRSAVLAFKDLSYLAPGASCYFRVLMLLVHCFPPPQRFPKGSCCCLCLEATLYFQRGLISWGLVYCLSWSGRGCVGPAQVSLNEQECCPVRKEPLLFHFHRDSTNSSGNLIYTVQISFPSLKQWKLASLGKLRLQEGCFRAQAGTGSGWVSLVNDLLMPFHIHK